MSPRRPKTGVCAYCGTQGKVTRDHVIPRALFVRPYPKNPIIVPACRPCNKGKSHDEDYLRDFLALDYRGSQSPVAQELLRGKVPRSLARSSSELLRVAMRTIRARPLETRAGIYLGDYLEAPVDDDRLYRVLGLVVRGLYYSAREERLLRTYRVVVVRHDPWDYQRVCDVFLDFPSRPITRRIGDGQVFWCAFRVATEDPQITLWQLWFYDRVLFSASSEPSSELADE